MLTSVLSKLVTALGRPKTISTTVIDCSDLRVGEIRTVTETACVARTEEGVFAFARRCPHAGADLTTGHIADGKIRCSWHNLPFDLTTGQQPCKNLKNLKVYPLKQLDPDTYELTESR